MTIEEILEVMGCDPDEYVECEDGFIMTFGTGGEENGED